ncbi:MAG TPA: hypothetical protein VLQ93_11015, partial [Myxococcaceae bacterium]|nr:hypothetical protein [Myxococcaceae bacterium]
MWGLSALAAVATVTPAHAIVLTFEDLNPSCAQPLPWNHGGFRWNSYAYVMNKGCAPGSGYEYGTLGNVSLFTGWETGVSMSHEVAFDFDGAYITRAWDSSGELQVDGYRNGVLVYSRTVTAYQSHPTWFDFDFLDVDTVWFRPLGDKSRDHTLIDNITLNERRDTLAPTLRLDPLPAITREPWVTVSGNASDDTGVTSGTLLWGSQAVPLSFAPNGDFSTTVSLGEGQNTLGVEAFDAAGNRGSAQATLVLDTLPPRLHIVSPSGTTVADSMTVAVDVADVHFASVECSVDGVSLGASEDARFSAEVDLLGKLDGSVFVSCTARDLAGNESTETVSVTLKNWTLELHPRTLGLASVGSSKACTLYVEGINVFLLLPFTEHELRLVVPGGESVPVTVYPGSATAGDQDGDGIADVTLKFDRQALTRGIRAGIAAGNIDPRAPLE